MYFLVYCYSGLMDSGKKGCGEGAIDKFVSYCLATQLCVQLCAQLCVQGVNFHAKFASKRILLSNLSLAISHDVG